MTDEDGPEQNKADQDHRHSTRMDKPSYAAIKKLREGEASIIEPWEELNTIFDRGLNYGVERLSPKDRELFLIQSFIIDYEMGGRLYNSIPDWLKFDEIINAMQHRGLSELAAILSAVKVVFETYHHIDFHRPGSPQMTWSEVVKICDPNNKLEDLYRRIGGLDNYGIPCPCRELKPEHIDGVARPRIGIASTRPTARTSCGTGASLCKQGFGPWAYVGGSGLHPARP